MRKRLVVANWKMHPGTLVEAKRLFTSIARRVARVRTTRVVVCPPEVYLTELSRTYRGTAVSFGAQDVSTELKEGSFTGEVSGTMLKRLGVSYVIVGHSERRARGETDKIVTRKVNAALAAGLVPIVCVGETERDSDGNYLRWLEEQIVRSLGEVSRRNAAKLILAYEPLWAIGKTAAHAVSPSGLHEMSLFITKVLVRTYGRKTGIGVPVLYGGSVEPGNVMSLASEGGVSGFLVGHASLVPDSFVHIVQHT